jgi:hypothetical protein
MCAPSVVADDWISKGCHSRSAAHSLVAICEFATHTLAIAIRLAAAKQDVPF